MGRSFFGFLGILRCTWRQDKVFFVYFGVKQPFLIYFSTIYTDILAYHYELAYKK